MKPTVTKVDITNLVHDLSEISELSSAQITENILNDFGQRIVEEAKVLVPVKSGTLKESISYQVNGPELEVDASAEYADFVEFGTASRGEYPGKPYPITPKKGKYLKFTINGRTVYSKKVMHPGISAQPYLRPAAIKATEELFPKLLDLGQVLIVKGPKSAL